MGIFDFLKKPKSQGSPLELVAQAEKEIVEGKMKNGVELFRRALRDDPKVADKIYNPAYEIMLVRYNEIK